MLRNRQLGGYKFRRQWTVGPHVVDFACLEPMLVVELDGGQHNLAVDAARTRFLENSGYAVLRFWNNEVINQRDGVLETILRAALERSARKKTLTQPSPAKAGEGQGAIALHQTRPFPSTVSPPNPFPMSEDDIRPDTRLVEGGRRPEWTNGIVNPAVWRASTILFDDVAHLRRQIGRPDDGLYYGRRGTPTQWALADALTGLEPGAAGTTLHPSGVAAITAALLALLEPGDELLVTDSVYEPTRHFCDGMLARLGVTTRYYDPAVSGGDIDALFGPHTRAVFCESPGSLTFEVQDVPAIAAAAKRRGCLTLLDNTWATPLLFPALANGVDVSILACTKYVVGHSDAMLGSCTAVEGVFQRIRRTAQTLGQHVGPDDAWLGLRGLRTMGVRLRQHGTSGLRIARWLAERPEVAAVIHPALPGCPGHDLFRRDFAGPAGLFAFAVHGGEAARVRVVDALRRFGIGFSWGGYESLALPIDPERCRTAVPWASPGAMIRLQIGLEDPDDLIADLDQALAQAQT